MSKVIKIRKGLDISLVGQADKALTKAPMSLTYALTPDDYQGVTPKLLVKVGDEVKAGSALFFDKQNPEMLFTSPVSGVVSDVVRGDKRKLMAVVVTPDGRGEAEKFFEGGAFAGVSSSASSSAFSASSEAAREVLLKSGLWACLIERPFGRVAGVASRPKAIFVSGLDTSPLAGDLAFMVQDRGDDLRAGLEFLKLVAGGDAAVHVTFDVDAQGGVVSSVSSAATEVHSIQGPHPAGNVGVQIAAISPMGKGDVVWTVDIQHLAMIGRFAATGMVDMTKVVALTGAGVRKPHYVKMMSGASVESLLAGNVSAPGSGYRVISGNPLTGRAVSFEGGCVGFYHNQISVIEEGDKYEMFGWALPRFNKFSYSRSYFSWMMPGRKYNLDTNLNGGERAFVMNGLYEQVMPMDIYPVYLLKAIMAGDIDKMEQLGIYEVVEEDVALCEFVCPSKIEWQSILREGINNMIKEL